MLEEKMELIANSLSNISGHLERIVDCLERAEGAVGGRPAPAPATVAEDVAPEAPARRRRTKAEMAADKQNVPAEPPTDMFETTAPQTKTPEYTELDVRNFAKAALDVCGWEVVEALIGTFAKSRKVKDIRPADYPEVVAKLDALVKKGPAK